MSRSEVGTIVAMAVLVTLGFSNESRGEDSLGVPLAINCGSNCGRTLPNHLMTAIPGGTFVITVAHLAPSPEDAFVRGVPRRACDPVKFRIDTFKISRDGSVDVELGDQQQIGPGEASQVVHSVDQSPGTAVPSYELDLMGFRFRSGPATSRCNIVASGLFYPEPLTLAPIPISLIPSVGPLPKSNGRKDR